MHLQLRIQTRQALSNSRLSGPLAFGVCPWGAPVSLHKMHERLHELRWLILGRAIACHASSTMGGSKCAICKLSMITKDDGKMASRAFNNFDPCVAMLDGACGTSFSVVEM